MEPPDTKSGLRVLLLEDTPTDAELIERELRKAGIRFTAMRVERRDAFERALEEFHPDIVLSDHKLPDLTGLDALEIVRHDYPQVPVIMVTGALSDIDAVELIHAGAKDYVLKDRLARLAPAVQRVLAAEQGVRERKLAQEAVVRKERYYRKIIEGGSEVFFVMDGAGTLLYVNDSAKQLAGWDAAEVLGRPITDFVAVQSLPLVQQAMAETLANPSQATRLEVCMLRKDGTQVEVEALARNLLDDPDVAGIVITARDISERKRSEQALAASEKRFRDLLDNLSDWVWEVDDKGIYTYCSPRVQDLLGYEPAELIGKSPFDLMPAAEAARVDTLFGKHVAARTPLVALENTNLHKDGREVVLETSGVPVFDSQGTFKGYRGVDRDITERKRAVAALATANRALRTLSDCNHALVHAATESELLDSICRLVVETGGYRMAWVGFPEQDAAKTVRPVARYGYDEGFLAAANISWADTELGRGPSGVAIRSGTVQVNQNLLVDPALTPWRESARTRGYQSSIALPLKSATATLGMLTIYADQCDTFNEVEVSLLQELAEDLAYGIGTRRTQAERDRIALEQLHHVEILHQSLEDSIKAVANTVEMRDPYTAGHQRRVGQLAVAIAQEMDLEDETRHGIELAASIHDLGKSSVPSEILAKPVKLSAIEFMLLKNHAQAGYEILKDIKFPWPIATIVLQHHERLDGSGYPQGLQGEQILLESRIMAVADVVEAMASHRPYRPSQGIEAALAEIEQGRATQFDPAVVDACLRLFAEKRFAFTS